MTTYKVGDKLIYKSKVDDYINDKNIEIYIIQKINGGTYFFENNVCFNKSHLDQYMIKIEDINEYYDKQNKEKDDSKNNGGETDYYKIDSAPFKINDFDDFAEWRNMNGFQFNIGKVAWTFNVGRHNGTDQLRDINKVIHYAEREKKRILKELEKEKNEME